MSASKDRSKAQLLKEIEGLRSRLDEAEQTIEAIRTGASTLLWLAVPTATRSTLSPAPTISTG